MRSRWKLALPLMASLGLAATGVVATTALAAPKPVILNVWDMSQSSYQIAHAEAKYIGAFERAHPGVKVKLTVIPYANYFQDLAIAVKAGKAPDVATLDEIWTPAFAASGAIIPLSKDLKAYHVSPSQFFSSAWSTTLYHGRSYAVPWSFDVWEQLYYNKTMFKKAGIGGPPKTWPEMLADAKRLTHAPNQYGVALIGHKGEDTVVVMDSLIYSNGGSIINSAGKVTFDSPRVVQALQFYKNLSAYAPSGTASSAETDSMGLFTAGKVAMVFDGSWQQATIESQAPKMAWGIAVPPAPPGKTFHGSLGGWNLAIFSQSRHQSQAFQYIKFMTNPTVEEHVASLIPANVRAGHVFVTKNRRQPQVILHTLATGKARPISPSYLQISTIEQNVMAQIWAGTPVATAVRQGAAQMQTVVGK